MCAIERGVHVEKMCNSLSRILLWGGPHGVHFCTNMSTNQSTGAPRRGLRRADTRQVGCLRLRTLESRPMLSRCVDAVVCVSYASLHAIFGHELFS